MIAFLKRNLLVIVLIAIVGTIAAIQLSKPRVSTLPEGGEIRIEELPPEGSAQNEAGGKEALIPPSHVVAPSSQTLATKRNMYARAKELVRPSGFTNTDPFLIKDLIGKKVILVDFWTYSCINCQRTTPYLNEWYRKYKDRGLVIVGVHTPEFAFEQAKDNVDRAVAKFNIRYPVVLDNEYGTWNAYGNRFWPHKYLIDIDGFIVYDHIGEGAYEATEAKIQALLDERAQRLGESAVIPLPITTPKDVIAFEPSQVKSPEVYFGSGRNSSLGNGTPLLAGMQVFESVADPKPNTLYLTGTWTMSKEYAQNLVEKAKITYRYTAKNVYMVLGAQEMVRVSVLRDGKPLDATTAGKDIRFEKDESVFYVSEERLYDIVNDQAGYGTHTLEFTVSAGGLQVFTFTFG